MEFGVGAATDRIMLVGASSLHLFPPRPLPRMRHFRQPELPLTMGKQVIKYRQGSGRRAMGKCAELYRFFQTCHKDSMALQPSSQACQFNPCIHVLQSQFWYKLARPYLGTSSAVHQPSDAVSTGVALTVEDTLLDEIFGRRATSNLLIETVLSSASPRSDLPPTWTFPARPSYRQAHRRVDLVISSFARHIPLRMPLFCRS